MALIDPNQLSNLRELAAGDTAFLVSVIDAFLPQLDNVPGDLKKALADGAQATVVELAHSLKGSAGNVGAEDVSKLCLDIEQLARHGDLGATRPLIDELASKAQATLRAFEAEKAQLV